MNARFGHCLDIFGHMPSLTGLEVARPAATARHIVEAAAEHGLDAAGCLSGTGLSPHDLLDPDAEILPTQELAIIRNVIARLEIVPDSAWRRAPVTTSPTPEFSATP